MKNELVSVITPSYNSAQFIGQMIESILSQTYTDWELLITDDCSTDDSCDIIQKYAEQDRRIKLFKLAKNSGAGFARNESIKHASGRYIAFCDSDDMWRPDKLRKQVDFMQSNNYQFTFTSYDVVNEEGVQVGQVEAKRQLAYASLLRSNEIGCLTSMYDSKYLGKMYFPIIRKRQDWGLWLSVIKKSQRAYGLNESLAIYRDRKNSISSNKVELLKYNFRLYNEVEGFSKTTSILMLLIYFLPYHLYKKVSQKINYKRKIMSK